jgi:hypothetical protein
LKILARKTDLPDYFKRLADQKHRSLSSRIGCHGKKNMQAIFCPNGVKESHGKYNMSPPRSRHPMAAFS